MANFAFMNLHQQQGDGLSVAPLCIFASLIFFRSFIYHSFSSPLHHYLIMDSKSTLWIIIQAFFRRLDPEEGEKAGVEVSQK